MRINKYFMTILVASALLASCSQENDETSKNDGQPSAMRVRISYDDNSTYAVDGPLTPGSNTTLQSAILFEMVGTNVFKATALTSQQISDINSATGCRIENVNSTVSKVFLVGNPTASDISAMKLLRTQAEIEAYAVSVSSQQTTVDNAGVKNVTIMGGGNVVEGNDPNPDGHVYKETMINAVPVVSRLEVAGKVKSSTEPTNQIKTITWKNVYFNRFYTTLKKDVLSDYKANNWNTLPSWTTDTYTTTTEGSTQCYAYQFFPATTSNADLLPMIVMKADVELVDGRQLVDHYITLKSYTKTGGAALEQMVVNKIYKVDLSQLTIDHTDFTPDPNPDMTDLSVKVTIVPWTSETIIPEI